MTIVLQWQVLSNQHIYWQRWRIKYMKAEAKRLKAKRQEEVRSQRKGDPVDYELWIWIRYYHWSLHKRDIDNYAKLVLDCMTDIVYLDDSQIKYMYLSKYIDKSDPRVEIEIKQSYN